MIADINTPVRAIVGKTSDTTYQVARLDPSTHAFEMLTHEIAEINDGRMYEVHSVRDQTVNHVWDIQMTAPAIGREIHLMKMFEVEAETEWYFYENVNIILAGTAVTPINRNRNSINVSDLIVATITNTSVANANADTAVAGATVLDNGILGAGKKVGGDFWGNHKWILKKGEDYCLRFIATAGGFVNYKLDWHEHLNRGA